MYDIDEHDQVREIEHVPRPDGGAPIPVVVADDLRLWVAYRISGPGPEWDGSYVTVKSADSDGESIALVEFQRPEAHYFGMPNDEAFAGHPLHSRGLRPYMVAEVIGSSWIRKLERVNSVHPRHSPQAYAALRHFVFAFHDTTFETVAAGFSVTVRAGSIREVAHAMVEGLG